jgi:hypothetical protein
MRGEPYDDCVVEVLFQEMQSRSLPGIKQHFSTGVPRDFEFRYVSTHSTKRLTSVVLAMTSHQLVMLFLCSTFSSKRPILFMLLLFVTYRAFSDQPL